MADWHDSDEPFVQEASLLWLLALFLYGAFVAGVVLSLIVIAHEL